LEYKEATEKRYKKKREALPPTPERSLPSPAKEPGWLMEARRCIENGEKPHKIVGKLADLEEFKEGGAAGVTARSDISECLCGFWVFFNPTATCHNTTHGAFCLVFVFRDDKLGLVVCFNHVSLMFHSCFTHVSIMFQSCFRHETCLKHV
jgi:hypothetical protein